MLPGLGLDLLLHHVWIKVLEPNGGLDGSKPPQIQPQSSQRANAISLPPIQSLVPSPSAPARAGYALGSAPGPRACADSGERDPRGSTHAEGRMHKHCTQSRGGIRESQPARLGPSKSHPVPELLTLVSRSRSLVAPNLPRRTGFVRVPRTSEGQRPTGDTQNGPELLLHTPAKPSLTHKRLRL